MKLKRVLAYIIDIYLVTFISTIIFSTPIFANDYIKYENSYESNLKSLISLLDTGSSDPNEEEMIEVEHTMYKSMQPLLIIKLGLYIFYFGIISFIWEGQTIGKRLLKLQIKSTTNELNPNLFMLRQTLVTNTIPEIIFLVALLTASSQTWFIISGITSYIKVITTCVIGISILTSNNGRGIHDRICKTLVTERIKEKA